MSTMELWVMSKKFGFVYVLLLLKDGSFILSSTKLTSTKMAKGGKYTSLTKY